MVVGTKNFGIGRCVLALEVRSRKFGFVVVEGSRLLDWGIRTHGGGASFVGQKIGSLLDLYPSAVIVVRRRGDPTTTAQFGDVLRAIKAEARWHSATVRVIRAQRVREFFADHGQIAKHDIASGVAEQFADLAWNVPPKRKPWQGEYYSTPVFDAAATALAFLSQHSGSVPLMAPPLGE